MEYIPAIMDDRERRRLVVRGTENSDRVGEVDGLRKGGAAYIDNQ